MNICDICPSLNFNKIGETLYGIYAKVSALLRKPGFIMVLIWLKITITRQLSMKVCHVEIEQNLPNGLCRGILFFHFVKNA
jgi:hypothetical protein